MGQACSLTCRCGEMQWHIDEGAEGRHMMCYCADCQTAARHLGQADAYLTNGGTQLFQTVPGNIHFDKGRAHLRMFRLSPNGIFRWYAKCCNTPIANTLPKSGFPFVGAVLPAGHTGFGRISARVRTKDASARIRESGMIATVYGIFFRAAKAAITKTGTATPFFNDTGGPVAEAEILTLEKRNKARPS